MAPPIAASPIRVAIIDDDSGLVTVLDRRFAALRWEPQVLAYAFGPDQLAAMRLHAVILNPEITGLDYLERLAMSLPGPALLVCTGPAPVADRVRGLRGGADDWITKPCHPEELVARIQAVLRRHRVGELPVDDLPLVAGELEIQRVWGYTMARGDRSVDVFVRKLRQKLEQLSPNWRYVHTHFGVGYRFAAERVVPELGVAVGPDRSAEAPAHHPAYA